MKQRGCLCFGTLLHNAAQHSNYINLCLLSIFKLAELVITMCRCNIILLECCQVRSELCGVWFILHCAKKCVTVFLPHSSSLQSFVVSVSVLGQIYGGW